MKLHTRRIIYLLFFLFFFITAPVVVLYTTGYRWNHYKNKVDKIGNLVIRTAPKKVVISLNDSEIEKTTPWRFNNLLPNKYNIKISKQGFSPWEKNLSVNSGETTFAEHIYLFKINPTSTPIVNQVDFWTYNESQNLLLFQKNNEFKLLNFNNNLEQKISDLNEQIIEFEWSENKQSLFLTTKNYYYFWRLPDPSKLNQIPIVTDKQNKNCHLLKDNPTNVLCSLADEIFYLDPFSLSQISVLKNENNNILDFYFQNNLFYFLEKNNEDGNIYLRLKEQNFNKQNFPNYLLPFSDEYKFLNIQNNKATILDQKNKKLYLLNLDKDEQGFNNSSKIFNDVKQAFYAPDNTLVFYNPWEIWTDKNGFTSLITRQSEPILEVLWYFSNNHLLLTQANSLEIIELDERDRRNRAQLLTTEYIKKASFDKTGSYVIYSTGNSNDFKQDVFMIEILPKETDFSLPNLRP